MFNSYQILSNFRHQGNGSERVHADRPRPRHRSPRHDVRLPSVPPEPETTTIRTSDASESRALPHVRVDRRALRHELVDGFGEFVSTDHRRLLLKLDKQFGYTNYILAISCRKRGIALGGGGCHFGWCGMPFWMVWGALLDADFHH